MLQIPLVDLRTWRQLLARIPALVCFGSAKPYVERPNASFL